MNIRLGEKIRTLRKSKNLSQEVLANYLGVSFQAVSKWEKGETLPDVTLIPAIACFFEVSTDELFDFNRLEMEHKVQQACWEIAEIRYDDPAKAEQMLRELLKQYPGNEVILNNLLYTMRDPSRHEEVVTLCKSILEVTKYDDVKYDVLRILAETYHEMGQQVLVKPTLEQIPEIYFSKLELAAKLLEGEDAMTAARQQAGLSRDDLLDMLSRMCQLFREQGQKVQAEEFAELTRNVYAIFEGRADILGYSDRECAWLEETVWSRLKG
jgi:transcriptional regulator with XRE-family HTH domain